MEVVGATICPDLNVGDAWAEDLILLEDEEVLPEVEDSQLCWTCQQEPPSQSTHSVTDLCCQDHD